VLSIFFCLFYQRCKHFLIIFYNISLFCQFIDFWSFFQSFADFSKSKYLSFETGSKPTFFPNHSMRCNSKKALSRLHNIVRVAIVVVAVADDVFDVVAVSDLALI